MKICGDGAGLNKNGSFLGGLRRFSIYEFFNCIAFSSSKELRFEGVENLHQVG